MRFYISLLFIGAFILMASLFGVMRYMDPYYYYGASDKKINSIRYSAVDYPEVSKPYAVNLYRPKTLILGTSRAQIGLDPSNKRFEHAPVYNLGYAGSNMRRTLALFNHAVASNEIKQVVLTLDLFMFRAIQIDDRQFSRLSILPDGSAPKWWHKWRALATDWRRVNFSSEAIKLATFDFFNNSNVITFMKNNEMRWVVRKDGHNELLNGKAFNYEKQFDSVETSYAKDYAMDRFCLSLRPGYSSLDELRMLFIRARELNIDLRVAISPEHANLTEIIAQSGLWGTWEAWKREIIRLAEQEATPNWSVMVFDFSGYNEVTMEPVPINTPEVEMKNYWDPSHYKRYIGDRMLNVILRSGRYASDVNFGQQISSDSIEQHLQRIRHDRAAWRIAHPEQVSRIKGNASSKPPELNCIK